jgi:hypothetical protein
MAQKIESAAREAYRPSYGIAAIGAFAVFVLYAATLAPTTVMWDASEYIAAVKVLGLPHPPGNPLFVLLGHAFALLPIPVSYAARINMFGALMSAISAGLWFLVTERILSRWLAHRWQRIAGAAVAVIVGAASFTVWNQSVAAEKVYSVNVLGIALVSWIMLRWSEAPDAPRALRLLVLVAFLVGLGYANHPAGFLVIPAVGVAILARRPRTLLRWRLMLACLGALLLGLTPFAFEPIRAAQFPPLNEGEPTGCATHLEASCTFSGLTLDRLWDNVQRTQYAKPSILERQAPIGAQLGLFWTYFKWQWLRDAYGEHAGTQSALAVAFLLLGLAGAREHWRRDRDSFWYFGTLMFTLTIALVFYLNFRYSWGQAPELGRSVAREPRERDYFFVWTFSAWSVWTALGIVALWQGAARLVGGARPDGKMEPADESPRQRSWMVASPLLAIALIPLFTNASQASRRGETFTRDWAVDLLNSVEPYAVIITNGDNDTFPLWYAQDVEGVRKDVIVAVTTYVDMDWFVRQIIRRPVYEYDAARGPSIYRGREWPKPDGPPLDMTLAQADSLPGVVSLREPQRFVHGNLVATVGPGYISRGQIVVLRMILDSFPGRPIYFSAGSYAQQLGLGPYLLTQGMVQKLMPDSVKAAPGIVATPSGYFDVARTEALWDSVYRAPAALIRQGDWVDRPSAGIAFGYVITGEMLAQALQLRGDSTKADSLLRTADAMAKAARLDDFLATISR